MKPIIGITCSVTQDGYSVRRAYADAVLSAGGEPVLLPCTLEPSAFTGIVAGVLLTGGGDILPRFYNAEQCAELDEVSEPRDVFELALCEAAISADLPVLCVCRGMQVLNCTQGGTLIQHIDNHKNPPDGALTESLPGSRRVPGHDIEVMHGTILWDLLAGDPDAGIQVNSRHHQALHRLGRDIIVSARAADGTIEAVEMPGRRFVLGVQWHPEELIDIYPEQLRIFKAFVNAARK